MDWSDFITDLEIFLAGLGVAVVGLLFTRWRYGKRAIKPDNNITAFYGSVIGTVYAVVLAFQLGNVWQLYRAAQVNADEEASSVANFFHIAQTFAPPYRQRVRHVVGDYARLIVDEEWDAMRHERLAPRSKQLVEEMWRAVNEAQPADAAEQAALDHMISELSEMVRHRQQRELEMRSGIPGILWAVLVLGGILTVGFACSFGVDSFRQHLFQTVLLSAAICLVLIAIADIDRPYQGGVRVSSEPFQFLVDALGRNPK